MADPISSNLTPEVREALKAKVFDLASLVEHVRSWKSAHPEHVIGWTNGVFDLLHPGHVWALSCCKSRCDLLIVGINSDASTKRIKGEDRPKVSEGDRAMMVAGVPGVDCVLVFDEDFPEHTIDSIDPHLIMKGADYEGKQVAGAKGRALHFHPETPDRCIRGEDDVSTTRLIEQAQSDPTPPCCHMFWSGEGFTYAHYLAVLSALRVHTPDQLCLWTIDAPNSEWWNKLLQEPAIKQMDAAELLGEARIAGHAEVFERVKDELEAYHPAARVAQIKDMTMWKALWSKGGIALDMDTLSYRRFWGQLLKAKKSFISGGIPATGVMGALVGSPVARWLDDWCERNMENLGEIGEIWNTWTFFAPTALTHYVNQCGVADIEITPTDWFYKFYDSLDAFFSEDEQCDLSDIRVLHLYGEGRREMPNTTDPDELITPEFVASSQCVYARIAREVLAEDLGLPPEGVLDGETRTLTSPGDVVTISQSAEPMDDIDPTRPLITLTVVMKDEEENVDGAFESVLPVVDQWIIVDTGSSDGTVEKARAFFSEHDIPEIPEEYPKAFGYRIYERQWKGYTLSRQEALELCMPHCNEQSYVMKLDMDERVVNAKWIKFAMEQANPDVIFLYCYQQGDPKKVRFGFPRAWHVRTESKYAGSDHELPTFQTQQLPFYLEDNLPDEDMRCYVLHEHDVRGPDGLADTIMLLSRDIDAARARGQRDLRAEFYLGRDVAALSLRQGEYWLRRRLDAEDDWQEERFFAHLYLGDNLHNQGEIDEAIDQWEAASGILEDAREPLLRIGGAAFALATVEEGRGGDSVAWWKKCREAYEKSLPLDSKPDIILFEECACYEEDATEAIAWRLAIAGWKTDGTQESARAALERLEGLRDLDLQEQQQIDEWKQTLSEELRAAPCGQDSRHS